MLQFTDREVELINRSFRGRSRAAEETWASRTPQERSTFCRKRGESLSRSLALMSREERETRARNSFLSEEAIKRSGESRLEYWANLTEEERLQRGRSISAGLAAMTEKDKSVRDYNIGEGQRRYWEALPPEERESRGLDFKDRMDAWRASLSLSERLEINENIRQGQKRFWASLSNEEISRVLAGGLHSLDSQRRAKESHRVYLASLTKEEMKVRMENSCLSPEAVLKSRKSAKVSPSEPEVWLEVFLGRNFPDLFGYNGDGGLDTRVGIRIPDFVRKDGIRQVISVMGGLGYYHFLEDEEAEVVYYREFGYDCLVVWEWECYLWDDLLEKIRSFIRRGGE